MANLEVIFFIFVSVVYDLHDIFVKNFKRLASSSKSPPIYEYRTIIDESKVTAEEIIL